MKPQTLTPEQVRAAMRLESNVTAPMDPEGAAREAEAEEPEPQHVGGGEQPDSEPSGAIFETVDDVVQAYSVIVEAVALQQGRTLGVPEHVLEPLTRVTPGELVAVKLLGKSALPILNLAKLPPVVAAAGLALLLGVSVAMRSKAINRAAPREAEAKSAEPKG